MAAGKKDTLFAEILGAAFSQAVAKDMGLSYCQDGDWAFTVEVGPNSFEYSII